MVVPGTRKEIGPHAFANWGAHYDGYPCAYFTAAAAIGMRREEVDTFAKRLDKVFVKFKNKHDVRAAVEVGPSPEAADGGGEDIGGDGHLEIQGLCLSSYQ